MVQWFLFDGIDVDGAWVSVSDGVKLAIIYLSVVAITQFSFTQGTFVGTDLAPDALWCFYLIQGQTAPFPRFVRGAG